MRKLVYLFELDSVNNGVFRDAFDALFQEIVYEGNCVAVSMNQLCDSEFFTRAIVDDRVYPQLMRLLEIGAIRVSRYVDGNSGIEYRTPSQYLQKAIEECKTKEKVGFIFSNLPVSNEDKILLEAIEDALKYGDINKIEEMALRNNDSVCLKHIKRFIEMVLKISISEITSIPAKETDRRTMEYFMDKAIELLSQCSHSDEAKDAMVKAAIESLSNKRDRIIDRNKRSAWYAAYQTDRARYPMEFAIIDCCYNYAVEDSIDGICKSYDEQDFENNLRADLWNRIQIINNSRTIDPDRPVKLHRWKMMCRFAEYGKKFEVEFGAVLKEVSYWKKMRWRVLVIGRAIVAFLWAIAYSALFFAVEWFAGYLEEAHSISVPNEFIGTIINIMISSGIGLTIGMVIKKWNKDQDVPDIFECMREMVWRLVDCIFVLFGGIYERKRMS